MNVLGDYVFKELISSDSRANFRENRLQYEHLNLLHSIFLEVSTKTQRFTD